MPVPVYANVHIEAENCTFVKYECSYIDIDM